MSSNQASTGQKAPRKLKGGAEIKASKANVVQQAKLMDSAGTAWFAVKHGNLEMITRLFPSQCNVYSKGPVGDNCFHIALLLNTPSTLAIAKYLVKLYGKTLVNTPYQERRHDLDAPGLYEGETALHIAIVNRDFDMVKFLIQAGADVRARSYGGFFQIGSVVYYGEYPLSFAACTGQKDIVSYLKRHGARVNHDRDMYGNAALHMCVYHDQLDMYDHLVEFCGASEHVRNNRGMTPMLLAASLGKLEAFQHIYNKRRKVMWAYGPVTSYSLSLHEIDSIQNARNFVPSSLEFIVRKGHMHMMDDPLIKTLLQTKWQRFACAQFLLQFACFLVLVIVQTFLVWVHCDPQKWNSYSREALEICSLILAAGFFILEIVDIVMNTISVSQRRKLMKANAKYCPPLYPIPGETSEVPVKTKSGFLNAGGFLTRLLTLGKSGEAGALGEGSEGPAAGARSMGGAVLSGAGAGAPGAWAPWSPDAVALDVEEPAAAGCSSGAQLVDEGATTAQDQGRVDGQARHDTGSVFDGAVTQSGTAAGPVAEGREGGGSSVQFQQVDDVGVTQRASSFTPEPLGTSQARPSLNKMMSLQPGRAMGMLGSQLSIQAPVDIVSVGLSSPAMQPALQPQPSFFMQPAASASMLNRQGEPAVPGVGSGFPGASEPSKLSRLASQACSTTGSLAKPGEERASNIGRDSSEIGSIQGQEIRNRLRGGGGGDLPAGGGTSVRRNDTKKSAAAQEKEELAAEDEREPLHMGGFAGFVSTLMHSLKSYYKRQASDPVTLLLLCHQLLTFIHFITWASSYGFIDGHGPSDTRVREFDDIIISLMALAGWTSTLYFARGKQFTGQMSVVIEMCAVEVAKFAIIYVVFNIGYTLAFYAVLNGTTNVVDNAETMASSGRRLQGDLSEFAVPYPFSNIGMGMMQLLRFMYGEAEYDTYVETPYRSKRAVATCYFILYIGTVLMLLVNLLIALLVHTYGTRQATAEKVWRLRWAQYVLRAEARMPRHLQQRCRLGEVSYDPSLQERVYNHVFEVVDEKDKGAADESEKEIKVLEAALERMRKAAGGKK